MQDVTWPSMVHYFSNNKAWVRNEITKDVLRILDQNVQLSRRKIILFLHNTVCHPETPHNKFKNH